MHKQITTKEELLEKLTELDRQLSKLAANSLNGSVNLSHRKNRQIQPEHVDALAWWFPGEISVLNHSNISIRSHIIYGDFEEGANIQSWEQAYQEPRLAEMRQNLEFGNDRMCSYFFHLFYTVRRGNFTTTFGEMIYTLKEQLGHYGKEDKWHQEQRMVNDRDVKGQDDFFDSI